MLNLRVFLGLYPPFFHDLKDICRLGDFWEYSSVEWQEPICDQQALKDGWDARSNQDFFPACPV